MQVKRLAVSPSILHNGGLGKVVHLLYDIQLNKAFKTGGLINYGIQLLMMKAINVLEVAYPVIYQTY